MCVCVCVCGFLWLQLGTSSLLLLTSFLFRQPAMKSRVKCLLFLGLLFVQGLHPVQAGVVDPCLPAPCLIVVFMALVGCMVPVRRQGHTRSRSPRASWQVQGPGQWINPRGVAVGKPPAHADRTLWDLNQEEQEDHQLGRKWDCDFLLMEILPCAVPIFGAIWEVGGSYNDAKDFPSGLEIATSPWTLRITGPKGTDMAAIAHRLRTCLSDCGPTGHPILAPPTSTAGCQRVLAKASRTTSGRQLADALGQVLEGSGCKLMIMKYGMKLPGEEAFGLLVAAKEAMASETDALTLQRLWRTKVTDWATVYRDVQPQ